ncbi:7,8-dihydro-6-hydroxymethylpterin dimethyltransferase [Candidatus Methanoperedenaceae archaeon GB50]|nr:7,8-dihydro-6-hydroxymethylpterin dimethyltransferase [Candidatus Methanoperedenaceae archaeon GB50]
MRRTKSLCPECLEVIEAEIFEDALGRVKIRKACDVHGVFEDIYWSDAELYRKFERYWCENSLLSGSMNSLDSNCPKNCGVCSNHKTTTILANIDVTNRCNQRCPICFANASAAGYIYEPSFDQIKEMLAGLRSQKPVPCPAVQFAGGEPTVRRDIVQIVQAARDAGFPHIQMATNGVNLAKKPELSRMLCRAGLRTVYLQFDGVTKIPYQIARGYDALQIKLDAIENCRASGLNSVALVPTIARGVNDDQIGDIVRFAAENNDTVKGINFQPISFTGRIDKDERERMRITVPDVFHAVEEQTSGEISASDFYPVPFVVPISRFVTAEKNMPYAEFSVHPHCGAGTYVYIEDGRMIPITRFIDVEGLLEFVGELASGIEEKKRIKSLEKITAIGKLIKGIPRFIDSELAPKHVNVRKLFIDVLKDGTDEATKEFHRNTLFIGVMHFQDLYNIDLERIQRCGIHYATPDGRVIPFCTYNTLHRETIERRFAKPLKSEVATR